MVPDTDSESLFHFPHQCGIGDFRRCISISHTVTGRPSQHGEITDADKVMNPQHFGSDSGSFSRHSDQNAGQSENLDSNPASLSVEVRRHKK